MRQVVTKYLFYFLEIILKLKQTGTFETNESEFSINYI